jgi:hypothetical protein
LGTTTEQLIIAAVTPAVMLSACALLALGLDNQAARMGTRLRELAREFRSLAAAAPRRATLREEVLILARRHTHYTRSLMCTYAALLAFVVTSLSALAAGYTGWSDAVPLLFFATGVVMLVGAVAFTLLAVRLSREALVFEEREVLGASRD